MKKYFTFLNLGLYNKPLISSRMMTSPRAFTLLEMIIVVIIVGILASLALPRFFRTVEFSKATEALSNLSAVRRAMDRCYLFKSTYGTECDSFSELDVEDPGTLINTHFTYGLGSPTATLFTITATRNTLDGGTAGHTITINQAGTKTGTGAFAGIK